MSFTITASGDGYVFTNTRGRSARLSRDQVAELAQDLPKFPAQRCYYDGPFWRLADRRLYVDGSGRFGCDGGTCETVSDIREFAAGLWAIL